MPTELACPTPPSPPALAAMDLAALQLRRVADRLTDAAAMARRLAAATDWQTPAARAFFAVAERLADDVLALGPVADAVRAEIALARARIAVANSWECR
jgi:hypothetical protein